MKNPQELLTNLIKSHEEVAEIWHTVKTPYAKGRYEQTLETINFLQRYQHYI
jgi:hypothetical protein